MNSLQIRILWNCEIGLLFIFSFANFFVVKQYHDKNKNLVFDKTIDVSANQIELKRWNENKKSRKSKTHWAFLGHQIINDHQKYQHLRSKHSRDRRYETQTHTKKRKYSNHTGLSNWFSVKVRIENHPIHLLVIVNLFLSLSLRLWLCTVSRCPVYLHPYHDRAHTNWRERMWGGERKTHRRLLLDIYEFCGLLLPLPLMLLYLLFLLSISFPLSLSLSLC